VIPVEEKSHHGKFDFNYSLGAKKTSVEREGGKGGGHEEDSLRGPKKASLNRGNFGFVFGGEQKRKGKKKETGEREDLFLVSRKTVTAELTERAEKMGNWMGRFP